jgi:predicted aldo/keto reductase-like oxidoreductase
MNYRKFGKLDWQASVLGFGTMRLPTIETTSGSKNKLEAVKLIRYAIDHGVNYVDTAYSYLQGKSETLIGKALQEGYRERVKLATKMPTWLVNSEQDMDKYLNEQLHRLCPDYVDFYLLHGLNQRQWDRIRKFDVLIWLEKKLDDGIIKHLGFSFHDNFDAFKSIIDGYDGWTFCQIQYNYMDADKQAGTRGLDYAASKGLAVVVMEPIGGGRLVNPPKEVQELWEAAEVKRTPAEWALRWVWNHRQVSVALSGMATIEQVIQNVQSASNYDFCNMTVKEFELIGRARQKYSELGFVPCSACGYCMPCPEGVNIPVILSLYNEYHMKEKSKDIRSKYWDCISQENQARRCVKCGKCEELCPQRLSLRSIISEAALIFESGGRGASYYPKKGLRLVKTKLRRIINFGR